MRQHNYWKIKQILNCLVKVVLWIFGILFLIINFLLKGRISFNTISSVISIVSIGVVIIWGKFEKSWWKNKVFQKYLPDQFKTPVLEGRWEGTLTRDGAKHDFVIEIRQTFSSIACTTYSEHSSSRSLLAEILYDENTEFYQLVYYWKGQTQNTGNRSNYTNTFNGFTIMDIDNINKRLTGSYFTDRQPKLTQGKLNLVYRQKELKNSFKIR